MSADSLYFGKDLEAMSFAPKYHKWLLSEFKPYIGKRLLEVGAGSGFFTQFLLELNPDKLYSIEPSPNMYAELLKNDFVKANSDKLVTSENILANFDPGDDAIDSIFYINVMEHIENDVEEMKLAYSRLKSGGHIFIFVPALQWLYGTHDKAVEHFRRYYKKELRNKVKEAGFTIDRLRYFDIVGVIPWYILFVLFKVKHLKASQAGFYDKYAVPVVSQMEKVLPLPFGKNLLLVARKP